MVKETMVSGADVFLLQSGEISPVFSLKGMDGSAAKTRRELCWFDRSTDDQKLYIRYLYSFICIYIYTYVYIYILCMDMYIHICVCGVCMWTLYMEPIYWRAFFPDCFPTMRDGHESMFIGIYTAQGMVNIAPIQIVIWGMVYSCFIHITHYS